MPLKHSTRRTDPDEETPEPPAAVEPVAEGVTPAPEAEPTAEPEAVVRDEEPAPEETPDPEEDLAPGGKNALQKERAARKNAEKAGRDTADRLAALEQEQTRRDVIARTGLDVYAGGDYIERLIVGQDEHEMFRSATALKAFASNIADGVRRGKFAAPEAGSDTVADQVMSRP